MRIQADGMKVESGMGEITLRWRGASLCSVTLGPLHRGAGRTAGPLGGTPMNPARERLVEDLVAYFCGETVDLRTAVDLTGHTDFQQAVWNAAREIPYGQVVTYGGLADRIGRPDAVRAVGGALGRNPVPLVIPCHRVVGADGSMTGFGCGVEWKQALLGLEGVLSRDLFSQIS